MEEILVVDDDSMTLKLIRHMLEREGIVAHCVSSGEEALESMAQRTFSLMITDYHMRGLDGLELARKGRALAPRMPIIMNTGDLSAIVARQAREIGIAKVITKPCLPEEMMASIRAVAGIRRAPQSPGAREATQSAGSSLTPSPRCGRAGAGGTHARKA